MLLKAILNASKSGLQRDPQRGEGAIPFFFLQLRMRRNYNYLACQELLTRTYFFRQIWGSRQMEWLQ
jgi:hypothetical protein